MARTTHETLKVFWLPAVASIAAPTQAELTAGTELTDFVPVDGVEQSPSRNKASQAMLGDAFVTEKVGTWSDELTITFVRDDAGDTPKTTCAYGTEGFLLLARYGTTAASDPVEVYPVQCHEPADLATAENEFSKYSITFAVTATPDRTAVMAA